MNHVTPKKEMHSAKKHAKRHSKTIANQSQSNSVHPAAPVTNTVTATHHTESNMAINISNDVLSRLLSLDYFYLHPDVARSGMDTHAHFEHHGLAEQRDVSVLFDKAHIAQQIKNLGVVFDGHFSDIILHGKNSELSPNRWLNLDYLRENNPAFADAAVPELILAILDGIITDVHPLFDHEFYLQQAAANDITVDQASIIHYIKYGWKFGLEPHPLFDSWYMQEHGHRFEQRAPLIAHLESERPWEQNIGPFIDENYINHCLAQKGLTRLPNMSSLCYLLHSKSLSADHIHPHMTRIMLDYIEQGAAVLPHELKTESTADSLQRIVRNLRLPQSAALPASTPEVSVIIVNYKKVALTLLSVVSAIQALEGIPYEILVVDNDGNSFQNEIFYRYFQFNESVKLIPTTKNLYFGEGNNIAIDPARGKYILFLNNDAFIDSTSLKKMLAAIEENDKIGAVGPIMFDAGCTIGEFGGLVSKFGEVVQQAKGRVLDKSFGERLAKMAQQEVDYISAACMLVRTEIVQQYGGFDYRFEPFYYEDTDLCMRIRQLGYSIVALGTAYSLHLENTSTREFLAGKFHTIVSSSKEKFFARWVLDEDEDAGLIDCSLIGTSAPNKKTMAIYTPFAITLGGGENYIMSLAAAASATMKVTLITDDQTSRTRYAFVLRDLGIEHFPFEISTKDEAAARVFDMAITMGNEIVPPWVPSAGKFIYHCQFPFPVNHSTRHFFGKNNYIDSFLVNSEFTKNAIVTQLKRYKLAEKHINILNPPVNLSKLTINELAHMKVQEPAETVRFVSVGRFFASGHCKRQDVIARTLHGVAKQLNISSEIYGGLSGAEPDQQFYQSVKQYDDGVSLRVNANVGRDTIENCFQHGHYYVHAAGLGINAALNPHQCEHFGITVVEAMANGCVPIVYALGGPAEIVKAAGVGYTFSTEQELEEIFTRVAKMGIRNEIFVKQVAQAHHFAQQFGRRNFYTRAQQIFTEIFSS